MFFFFLFLLLNPHKSFTGALNQLARNLACEWAKDGIRANAVAPNAIKTPLSQPVNQQDNFYFFFFLELPTSFPLISSQILFLKVS